MKNFLRIILPILTTFFQGCYKFFKTDVLPIINFIEAVKELFKIGVTSKDKKGIVDFIDWLMDKLGWNRVYLDKIIKAFLNAIKILLPDIITGKTFEECLLQYINYLKILKSWQLSFILLKTASLMIIELSPTKDLKENQADFLAQVGYTSFKYKI